MGNENKFSCSDNGLILFSDKRSVFLSKVFSGKVVPEKSVFDCSYSFDFVFMGVICCGFDNDFCELGFSLWAVGNLELWFHIFNGSEL